MRRKILALLMATGMMVLGIVGCGQTGEIPNAGDQAQGNGQTEESRQTEENRQSGTQDSGQSAPSQENNGVQASDSAGSNVPENTGVPVVYITTDISSDGLMQSMKHWVHHRRAA